MLFEMDKIISNITILGRLYKEGGLIGERQINLIGKIGLITPVVLLYCTYVPIKSDELY